MHRFRRGVFFARTLVALAAAAAVSAQGQAPAPGNMRLRLANSLCTSMTQQVVAAQLVPSGAQADSAVNQNMYTRMEDQQSEYFARMNGLVPFNGLYAVGQVDHSFAENFGGRYTFGLEWELLKEGRGESRRQLDRVRMESKTQYLQAMRDTEQRVLQEQLLAVEQMRSRLLATVYQREAAAVRPVLERRRQDLASGRITKAEVADMEYRAEVAALRARHYGATPEILVYPQAQELINRIEDVQLQPHTDLADLAYARSPEVQLQDALAERATLAPTMRDNTTVRLYLERNKDFFRDAYNTAGVRVRVPLGTDFSRNEAIAASRELYDQQKASVRATLDQRISLLAERMRLRQNDMRVLQAESRMWRQKAEVSCYRLDHPISSVTTLADADREVEDFSLRLVEIQREILAARLDTLEILTQISALVKPREPRELYVLGPNPR